MEHSRTNKGNRVGELPKTTADWIRQLEGFTSGLLAHIEATLLATRGVVIPIAMNTSDSRGAWASIDPAKPLELERYSIQVDRGLVRCISLLSLVIASDESLARYFGESTKVIALRRSDHDSGETIYRRLNSIDLDCYGSLRLGFAEKISHMAISFVAFHELAHIVRGHLDFPFHGNQYSRIADGADSGAVNEIRSLEDSVYYHAIEIDADIMGSRAIAERKGDNLENAFFVGASLALFYSVITPVCSLENHSSPSHPHPMVRYDRIVDILRQEKSEEYIRILLNAFIESDISLMQNRMNSVFGNTLGEDVRGKGKTMSDIELQNMLRDQVQSRLTLIAGSVSKITDSFEEPFPNFFG